MNRSIKTILTLLLLVALPGHELLTAQDQAPGEGGGDAQATTKASIVFVNSGGPTGQEIAADFGTLLEDNDYSFTTITWLEALQADFGDVDLIIIGPNTGLRDMWGPEPIVENISNSRKPILGLGYGGPRLFGQIDLSISWENCWMDTDTNSTRIAATSIYCVDPDHQVFRVPNDIPIPDDRVIRLYNHSAQMGAYEPYLSPDVMLVGREPDDNDHYSIVSEGVHLLWGFVNRPADMTETGKALFINVVEYVIGGER